MKNSKKKFFFAGILIIVIVIAVIFLFPSNANIYAEGEFADETPYIFLASFESSSPKFTSPFFPNLIPTLLETIKKETETWERQ